MRELPLPDTIGRDAFRALVYQFTEDLCFYRELIQNAIDAGSGRVDVWLEQDEDGNVIAHIQDHGDGMDRQVIDQELTRLFYSSKEDDLTKIGKFGVGFVSVFAISPDVVVLDTAHNGEAWRVLFLPSGEFERIRLTEPVSGTHVRVIKSMTWREFATFTERSRATIEHWCRYCSVDIFFNQERINQPLDVDAAIKVRKSEPGTEVVAAIVPPGQEFYGFYRGGITLWEGPDATLLPALASVDWLRGIAFRINSRYLEHTLSRDTVRSDKNFDKALKILQKIVTRDLMDTMYRLLVTSPDHPECALAIQHTAATTGRSVKWLPRVSGGPPVSIADLKGTAASDLLTRLGLPASPDPIVFWSPAPTEVTATLERLRIPVLAQQPLVGEVLRAQGFRLEEPSARLVAPQVVSVPSSAHQGLLDATLAYLKKHGFKFPTGGYGRWIPDTVPSAAMPGTDGVVAIGTAPRRAAGLLLHATHPLVARLVSLGESDMASAACLMARAVSLSLGLDMRV